MTFCYRVYGVPVLSDLNLGIPESHDPSQDPRILVRAESLRELKPRSELKVAVTGSLATMTVPHVGRCEFDDLSGVLTVQLLNLDDLGMAGMIVLNQALPFALAVRGELMLHAAAVALDNGALLYIGRRGVGKSHLAAMAVAAGRKILADDFVRLTAGREIDVQPSFPEVRLFSGDVERFEPDVRLIGRAGLKTRLDVSHGFSEVARPLTELWHLVRESSGEARLKDLDPAEKFQALMENCLFFPTFSRVQTERRLDLISRICTASELSFRRLDLAELFARTLNEVPASINL